MGVYAAQNGETSCSFETKAAFEALFNDTVRAFCLFNEYTAVNLKDNAKLPDGVALKKLDIVSSERETDLHAGIIILYVLSITFFSVAIGIFLCTPLNTRVVFMFQRGLSVLEKCKHAIHDREDHEAEEPFVVS